MALLPPPEVRRLRARLGGYALAAKHDPKEYTAAARETFRRTFDDQVDPERALPEGERARRAEAARRAFYTRLALSSIKSRNKKTVSTRSLAETVPPTPVEAKEARTSGTSQT